MKQNGKKLLTAGLVLLAAFILWTLLIQTVDVQAIGPKETKVGFAALYLLYKASTILFAGKESETIEEGRAQ